MKTTDKSNSKKQSRAPHKGRNLKTPSNPEATYQSILEKWVKDIRHFDRECI
jgi:hypothetical protein